MGGRCLDARQVPCTRNQVEFRARDQLGRCPNKIRRRGAVGLSRRHQCRQPQGQGRLRLIGCGQGPAGGDIALRQRAGQHVAPKGQRRSGAKRRGEPSLHDGISNAGRAASGDSLDPVVPASRCPKPRGRVGQDQRPDQIRTVAGQALCDQCPIERPTMTTGACATSSINVATSAA